MSFRTLLRRSRNLSALSVLALSTQFAGCGGEEIGDESDDITDVANTDVKKQSIGNCWIYASVGWAESLHLTHTGTELNLSESYISYWHWFEQIAGGAEGETAVAYMSGDELSTGGWFGVAAELMLRYGVMDEGGFISEEAEEIRSARQSSALNAINKSLKEGALKDRSARRDRALVKAELDKAWGLSPEVVEMMNGVFGEGVKYTLYGQREIPEGSTLQYANQIGVGPNISLADAIGKPASSYDFKKRKGTYAWTEVDYPKDKAGRREVLRRAQKAMHQRLPVIMTWFVDFNAMKNNVFLAPPETPGRQGGHMTVLEDYEIDNVPGFGTLKAGELVEDQAALDAALAEEATVKFWRIKNSWGTDIYPPDSGEEFRGYHDLHMEYLNGPIKKCTGPAGDDCSRTTDSPGMWGMVLPPPAFVTGGQGSDGACHDVCSSGVAMKTSCEDSCVAQICEADSFCCDQSTGEWDAQCVGEVSSICGINSCI